LYYNLKQFGWVHRNQNASDFPHLCRAHNASYDNCNTYKMTTSQLQSVITSLHSASYVSWQRGTARILPLHAALLPCCGTWRPLLSTDISCLSGPQQQTRCSGVQRPDGTDWQTDEWTDGQTPYHYTDPAPHTVQACANKVQCDRQTDRSNVRFSSARCEHWLGASSGCTLLTQQLVGAKQQLMWLTELHQCTAVIVYSRLSTCLMLITDCTAQTNCCSLLTTSLLPPSEWISLMPDTPCISQWAEWCQLPLPLGGSGTPP